MVSLHLTTTTTPYHKKPYTSLHLLTNSLKNINLRTPSSIHHDRHDIYISAKLILRYWMCVQSNSIFPQLFVNWFKGDLGFKAVDSTCTWHVQVDHLTLAEAGKMLFSAQNGVRHTKWVWNGFGFGFHWCDLPERFGKKDLLVIHTPKDVMP